MDILIYGYGKMTSAMVEGWLLAGLRPAQITAYNPRSKDVPPGIVLETAIPTRTFDAVVLGFKPHMLADIAPQMQSVVGPGTTIVSVLAGVELSTLQSAYPDAGGWVRFMPNLAVALGKSPNLLVERGLTDARRAEINDLAIKLGSAEWLADESMFDLATALSGSGPAFVYRFIDALGSAGAELGLDGEVAARLALQMVEGAAALASKSDFSPDELADRVASPGGMTREGLNVLDDDKSLQRLLYSTLDAAAKRGAELARQAASEG